MIPYRVKLAIKGLLSRAGLLLRNTPLAKSDTLNWIHGELSVRLHGNQPTKIGPFDIKFDRRDRFIAKKLILYKEYERKELDLLCSLANPGETVLDIGAQIGIHTLHLSKSVGPKGQVIAVEPDPDNLKLLKDNVIMNDCENVTILPMAFGDKKDEVKLYQNNINRGELSLIDLNQTGQYVNVPMFRGEDILDSLSIQVVSLVKIDVEGYESFVLKGLGRYMPNTLLFEFNARYCESFGVDPEDFLNSLLREGYSLELIDFHGGVVRRKPKNTPARLTEFSRTRKVDCNILATR